MDLENNKKEYIAHVRKDGAKQSVEDHFTAHGNVLHERVDSCEPEQRGNVRYERGVAVKSQQLRLTGKLDLLEIEGKSPTKYFPVEYKRGKPQD